MLFLFINKPINWDLSERLLIQPLPPSVREAGAEGIRKENAKLQENARNITSALDKNTRSPSPPTAELPLGGSPLNKSNSPINQNL